MTTTVAAGYPITRLFDISGLPLGGGLVYTYAAGSSTPQPTYQDLAGTLPNTNPVVLDSTGSAIIRYTVGVAYKLVLTDPTGSTVLSTLDNFYPPGSLIYPQTAAEIAASVSPVNFNYAPYTVDRYATNTTPGVTDMWQAITSADAAAHQAGAAVLFQPGELYGVNCTAHTAALAITSSWLCQAGYATIQRIDFTASTAYYTARASAQSNLLMRGLIFDGQVTTVAAGNTPNVELAATGSYADNGTESLWTKPYGVNFATTQGCRIEDCSFKNFLRAGLRVDCLDAPAVVSANAPPYGAGISLKNRVTNCKFSRNRGIFGDGFYAEETEDLYLGKCSATDYQRIGFVFQNNSAGGYVGANGILIESCVADFGHDAVISASQSNVGFWMELGDTFNLVNCESKSTMIGFFAGFSTEAAQGVWRSYTASHVFTGCKAIRCHQQGFRLSYSDDVHCVLDGCFGEVNRTAATYANCVGGAPCGVEIDFFPTGGVSAARIQVKGCAFDMVGFVAASLTQYAGINVLNGGVTNFYQLQCDFRDNSFRWLTSAGAADSGVQGQYEATSGSNYGYIGDIVFSGLNNGGNQFKGAALISNCVDHTFGYLLMSSEISGSSSVLTVESCNISMRTGGATNNSGTLFLTNCKVDMRGDLGWALVNAIGCTFLDWDTGSKDRTGWTASAMKLASCFITRQFIQNLNGGITTNRVFRLSASNCEWFVSFNTESGLKFNLSASTFAQILLDGCVFRNNGTGTMGGTKQMIEVVSSNGTLQISGAGCAYDNSMVSGGGHVIQVNTTGPTYNDTPATASGPWLSVNGVLATFGPI